MYFATSCVVCHSYHGSECSMQTSTIYMLEPRCSIGTIQSNVLASFMSLSALCSLYSLSLSRSLALSLSLFLSLSLSLSLFCSLLLSLTLGLSASPSDLRHLRSQLSFPLLFCKGIVFCFFSLLAFVPFFSGRKDANGSHTLRV